MLTEAGYAKLDKPTGLGGRPRTWVQITRQGRKALASHLAVLRDLAQQAGV